MKEHTRAGLLAEELEETQGRIRDEKQRLQDPQMANEELHRRLAEEYLHGNEVHLERLERELDNLTRQFKNEKADLQARSHAIQGRLKSQIGVLKKIDRQRRLRANVQAGRLQRELIELRSEFFSNMDAEHWNNTTNDLATEMMRSIEEKKSFGIRKGFIISRLYCQLTPRPGINCSERQFLFQACKHFTQNSKIFLKNEKINFLGLITCTCC
jgi:hypothetical protein